MKEYLESKGWVMFYECKLPCGFKQHYSNAGKLGYEIRTRPKNNTFSIMLQNQVIAGPFWGYQIGEKMNQFIT